LVRHCRTSERRVADACYHLIGVPSSPYSVKLRAILRYRRLQHDWVIDMPALSGSAYPVRPVMLPIMRAPDEQWYVAPLRSH
jgi:hypothetical protein